MMMKVITITTLWKREKVRPKKCISLFAEFILFVLSFVWLRYAIYIIAILSSCVEGVINVGIDFTLTNNTKRILSDLVVCGVRNVLKSCGKYTETQ